MALVMTRPVGRPRKIDLDKLRVKTWYYLVKSKKKMSDYRRDLYFLEKAGLSPVHPHLRIRIFENLRARWSMPCAGDHPRREFDLIKLVESDEDFTGTASVFLSPFWDILHAKQYDWVYYSDCAKSLMAKLGLKRVNECEYWRMVDGNLSQRKNVKPLQKLNNILYGSSLGRVAFEENSFDVLSLFCALYREAYLLNHLELAVQIKDNFHSLLLEVSKYEWLEEIADEFVDICARSLYLPHSGALGCDALRRAMNPDWEPLFIELPIIKNH